MSSRRYKDNIEDGRCPSCSNMAHGRFSAKCQCCGIDKTKYGYIVPKQKPFKNFLVKMVND